MDEASKKPRVSSGEVYQRLATESLEMAMGEHMTVTKLLTSLVNQGFLRAVESDMFEITDAGRKLLSHERQVA
jgi:DNA-binding PadR family transcriptional regulator